jgi:formiminoglutamase
MKHILDLLTPFQPISLKTREETLGQSAHSLLSIEKEDFLEEKIVILGVPDERGILLNQGNLGAKEGPGAFRKAFYTLYDQPFTDSLGAKIIDAGNVALGDDISSTHEKLANAVAYFFSKKVQTVVVVGGGHDFSYGSYKGCQQGINGIIPIINFDAHLDLRPVVGGQINSGTPFSRIIEHFPNSIDHGRAILELGIQQNRNPASLFDFADKHQVKIVEYRDQAWHPRVSYDQKSQKYNESRMPVDFIKEHLQAYQSREPKRELERLHISLDLDVFASWIAPGTSASTPFGCETAEVIHGIEFLMSASTSRVLDIAELCPSRDFNSQTARLAASVVYRALTSSR